jgi:glycerol uptake facilitator-like aquaporin
MEMNTKGMMAELIGSMAITLLVWGGVASAEAAPHESAVMAGAAGITLAIMWMTFSGSEILPIITIGNMASGRTDWETGSLNFCMQVLGALIAAGVESFGAEGAVMALLGGFLLMMVWDRLGGGWEAGAFAAVLIIAEITLSSASNLGGMIVESDWTQDNFVNVFGTMIVGGIGATAALMFGDEFLPEEE